MLAFYACTNTQIINMINVKEQYYRDENADLYILKKNRVDLDLIKCIEEANVFNSIVFIEPYVLPQNALNKIFNLFIAHSPNKYYRNYVLKAIGNKNYDKFLTFGFWADALYVLEVFYKKNKNIKVEFVEEGLVNYFPYDKELYYCRAYSGYKEKIIRFCAHGINLFLLKKRMRNTYMYKPQFIEDSKFELKEIRAVDFSQNQILKKIFCAYFEYAGENIQKYKDIDFVYLLDNYDFDRHISLIKYYYAQCKGKSFIIKAHPENTIAEIKTLQENFQNIKIDTSNFYFESIAAFYNLNNICLISRGSSSAYTMHVLFNVNYHNILIYKLFDYKNYDEIICEADKFWKFMNNIYGNFITINKIEREGNDE